MHAGELDVTPALVTTLIATQFPHWADLPLHRVATGGTDNTIYRLGEDLAVRLPRIDWAAPQVPLEHTWLPRLAPLLPAPIPTPQALGAPDTSFPWPWYVYRWLEGTAVDHAQRIDVPRFAHDIAVWTRALHSIPATGGPAAGAANHGRGLPLTNENRDSRTQQHIPLCADACDISEARAFWAAALETPAWDAAPVWVHGDLNPGNILVADGGLAGVIDFGCMGVGDPAVDLLVAWIPQGDAAFRTAYRTALGYDAATWARGRAWAFSVAVIALPYYRERSPRIRDTARQTIAATLADWRATRHC